MQKTTRRMFCGTALAALPALGLVAKEQEFRMDNPYDSSDPIIEAIADEFAHVTEDGVRNGFKSEHFRRYAGFLRMLDAQMENKGVNKELDKRLDDDDFNRLNPAKSSQFIADFWRKRNMDLRENEMMNIDWKSYQEGKKGIKKIGGARALTAKAAFLLELKAKQYETSAFRGGPFMREGRIAFPRQTEKPLFVNVDAVYVTSLNLGTLDMLDEIFQSLQQNGTLPSQDLASASNSVGIPDPRIRAQFDCICKAMIVMAASLAISCATMVCVPCCPPAALFMAVEKLMESCGICDSNHC
jgi:hypothetical protein